MSFEQDRRQFWDRKSYPEVSAVFFFFFLPPCFLDCALPLVFVYLHSFLRGLWPHWASEVWKMFHVWKLDGRELKGGSLVSTQECGLSARVAAFIVHTNGNSVRAASVNELWCVHGSTGGMLIALASPWMLPEEPLPCTSILSSF